MSNASAAAQLRPLTVGEVLDAAFKLYGRHFKALVTCVLVVAVPVIVLVYLGIASSVDGAFTDTGPTSDSFSFDDSSTTTDDDGAIAAGLGYLGAFFLLSLVTVPACVAVLAGDYTGESKTWQAALGLGLRRGFLLFVSFILWYLATLVGTILLIIPGIWIMIRLGINVPPLVVERAGPIHALTRSWRLTKNRWWATFGTLIVGYLIVTAISYAGQFLLAPAMLSDSEIVGAVVSAIAGIVAIAVTTPLWAAFMTAVYFDLRVRNEGFDLQQQLGAVPDAPAATTVVGGTAPPTQQGFLPPLPPPARPPDERPPG
jgi:hypothetical protein